MFGNSNKNSKTNKCIVFSRREPSNPDKPILRESNCYGMLTVDTSGGNYRFALLGKNWVRCYWRDVRSVTNNPAFVSLSKRDDLNKMKVKNQLFALIKRITGYSIDAFQVPSEADKAKNYEVYAVEVNEEKGSSDDEEDALDMLARNSAAGSQDKRISDELEEKKGSSDYEEDALDMLARNSAAGSQDKRISDESEEKKGYSTLINLMP